MTLNIVSHLIAIFTGFAIFWVIYIIRRKKSSGPGSDERTEKIAGKAAHNAIIVLMFVLAAIGWGYILDLFKLEIPVLITLLFFTLMMSMIGFRRYYGSKEI